MICSSMDNDNQTWSQKKIFIFWAPLAATWLMMACENPFLAAIIARLDEPKYNLAAFGIAFSFAIIVESPIIMLMSASTALVKDKDAYLKLRRFMYVLNAAITIIMLITITPPVFFRITETLMGLPVSVTRPTHTALSILLPWPAAIGFRRFYQGLLVRRNLTRRVAYGTAVRLSSMAAMGVVLYFFKVRGAVVGAAALSCGVVCEAIASRFMAHRVIKAILKNPDPGRQNHASAGDENNRKPLTYRAITRFYYPLALMSFLSLGVHPIVTFFMGKSRFPIESLAILPVINSLVFLFRSLGLSFHEVGVALMGERNEGYFPLRKFAMQLSAGVFAGLAIIVFTPLAETWFVNISGLSVELSRLAYLPARIMVFIPVLTVWISFQCSFLVNMHRTAPISVATAIEVISITLTLFISIKYLDLIGAVAAALAYTVGRIAANLYLHLQSKTIIVNPADSATTACQI